MTIGVDRERSGIPALDPVMRALADPTRRRVVELLSVRDRRAGDLSSALKTSAPTMSRHLRLLLDARVVEDRRDPDDARARVFALRSGSIAAVQAWLDQIRAHWDEQLDAFKSHVETTRSDGAQSARRRP